MKDRTFFFLSSLSYLASAAMARSAGAPTLAVAVLVALGSVSLVLAWQKR